MSRSKASYDHDTPNRKPLTKKKRCFKSQHPTSIKKANIKDPSYAWTHPLQLKRLFPLWSISNLPPRSPPVFSLRLCVSALGATLESLLEAAKDTSPSPWTFVWLKKCGHVPSWCKKDRWGLSRKNLRISVNLQTHGIFWDDDRKWPHFGGERVESPNRNIRSFQEGLSLVGISCAKWGMKATPMAMATPSTHRNERMILCLLADCTKQDSRLPIHLVLQVTIPLPATKIRSQEVQETYHPSRSRHDSALVCYQKPTSIPPLHPAGGDAALRMILWVGDILEVNLNFQLQI